MKYFFLTALMMHYAFSIQSQSYIGPTVGIDFARIIELNEDPRMEYITVYDHSYSTESFFYGIRGEQQVAKSLSLALQLFYTKKEFAASTFTYIPAKAMELKSFKGVLALYWFPIRNWHIGPGFTMNYIADVTYIYPHVISKGPFAIANKKEPGALLTTGYRYKNMLAEIFFNKGFSTKEQADFVDLRPINSFGFSLSYLLRVSKKR